MTTSLSRNKMMDRMSRMDTAYDAAKKRAHFVTVTETDNGGFALITEEHEHIIVSIDREAQTLTYKSADKADEQVQTVTAREFEAMFYDWRDNSQAAFGKQYIINNEISSVWKEAHQENMDFDIRKATAVGDTETVMNLVARIREQAEQEMEQLRDDLLDDDGSDYCVAGDRFCEVCS